MPKKDKVVNNPKHVSMRLSPVKGLKLGTVKEERAATDMDVSQSDMNTSGVNSNSIMNDLRQSVVTPAEVLEDIE